MYAQNIKVVLCLKANISQYINSNFFSIEQAVSPHIRIIKPPVNIACILLLGYKKKSQLYHSQEFCLFSGNRFHFKMPV